MTGFVCLSVGTGKNQREPENMAFDDPNIYKCVSHPGVFSFNKFSISM